MCFRSSMGRGKRDSHSWRGVKPREMGVCVCVSMETLPSLLGVAMLLVSGCSSISLMSLKVAEVSVSCLAKSLFIRNI